MSKKKVDYEKKYGNIMRLLGMGVLILVGIIGAALFICDKQVFTTNELAGLITYYFVANWAMIYYFLAKKKK